MKIEDASHLPPVRNDAVDRASSDAASGKAPVGSLPAGADSLTLSADAAITLEAIQKAAALPDIRQDKVEQVRKLLEQGEVGQNNETLADAIIDSLIDE